MLPAPPPKRFDSGDELTTMGETHGSSIESGALVAASPKAGPKGKAGPDDPDVRTAEILNLTLNRYALVEIPEPPIRPAPPAVPSQGDITLPRKKPPPTPSHIVGLRTSALQRMLNSTLGRAAVLITTLVIFNYSCYQMADWARPEYWANGMQRYWMFMAIFIYCTMYVIPLWAEKAGMSATETGWKPYYVMYRISFVTAIPAVICQAVGHGGQLAHGLAERSETVTSLGSTYWSYFAASDGFVALNLTKGVVETLTPTVHGEEGVSERSSRFRNAELRINREPYVDQVEPTEQPGMVAMYRVAPVFKNWGPCLSRYRISGACLQQNPVQAWAIGSTMSLCTEVSFVACRPPKPTLEPVYNCKSDPIFGDGYVLPVSGLCGRITLAPPAGAIDELRTLLLEDGWPTRSLPTAENVWLDVRPDACIGDSEACLASWNSWYFAGLALQVLTDLLIIVPLVMDCTVDYRIREARKFFEVYSKKQMVEKPKDMKASTNF